MSEYAIRTEGVPRCPLCGSRERKTLYVGLRDRLYGAPGEWTLKECCSCGLVFLDPRPTSADIGKAYERYYTHSEDPSPANTIPRKFWRAIRNGYLERKFGYRRSDTPAWGRRLAPLAFLHPAGLATLDSLVMYLPAPGAGARVLEVGCGNGRNLRNLQEWGWEVEGVEPDVRAVEIARSQGLDVHQGDLASSKYTGEVFDAVIANHVIEHVHNPVALMRQCWRVLRSNGLCVFVTPNVSNLTHRIFKSSVRHLESPRHLVLFNPRTMESAAEQAGMHVTVCTTTARGANANFLRTLEIRRRGFADHARQFSLLEMLVGWAYSIIQRMLLRFYKNAGEEILLIARKAP